MNGQQQVQQVLERRAVGDYLGAREVAAEAVAALDGETTPVFTTLLIELGRVCEELGDYEEAAWCFERASGTAEGLDPGAGRDLLLARALARLAGIERTQGRQQEAEPLLQRALLLVETQPAAIELSEVVVEAGRLAQDGGDNAEAERLFTRALNTAEQTPEGPEREGTRALALAALAGSWRRQGRYREAEPAFRQALALAASAFGPDSLEVSYTLNDLAITFKFSGRFDEAEQLYRRSLEILTRAVGTDEHPDVASLYHNLGGLEHARGRFAKAEKPARRSVEIRERALGPDHFHVAADRAALASILDALGRQDEAEQLLRQALAVFERHYGPDHYEVAVNLNNLAAIEQRRGNLEQAEALYRRALAIKERVLGPASPETGFTLNNLAVVCRRRGHLEEAEALYQRALQVLEGGLEPTHPSIITTLGNYARMLRATGRAEQAAPLEARAERLTRAREPLLGDELPEQ
jgi:tetratricopeptide (TPR) repeat protein